MAKTIEEKAKAYDKALAKFRESLSKHDLVGVNRGYLESIFSELKESEDENIRKEIIDFIKNSHNYWQPNDSIAKKWVAWLEKQSEQKPAWSEEDERMIDTIISDLERHGGKEGCCYSTEINWLKSLKDRVIPQIKQEWSEEDLYKIGHALFGTYTVDVATRLSNKIKSIRPQKHWKPTEEQIKALDYGIDDIKYCELGKQRIPILVGLLQQLKTL